MLIVYRESHIFHNQYSQNDKIVKLGSPQPWTTRNKSKLQKIFDQARLCLFFWDVKVPRFKKLRKGTFKGLYNLSPFGFMSKCDYKSFVIVTRSAKKRQTCCHNKIPSGICSSKLRVLPKSWDLKKSSEKNIFCNQPSPRCVNFLTRRHLALDWLLYSFFKGRTIFGRNNHKINLSKSGLLEQRCKYRWPILRGETDTNKATRAQVPGNKVDLGS